MKYMRTIWINIISAADRSLDSVYPGSVEPNSRLACVYGLYGILSVAKPTHLLDQIIRWIQIRTI